MPEFWGRLFGHKPKQTKNDTGDTAGQVEEREQRASIRRDDTTPVTIGEGVNVGPRYGKPYERYVGDKTAMAIATVFRCVDVLSTSVASLRFQYMRQKGGCFVEDANSPLHYLLTVQPQPEMSAVDFWTYAVQQMLLEGNAYIYPRYVQGELTDLVLCRGVAHDPVNGTYSISDVWSGVFGTFEEKDIIHLYLHTKDGRTGVSVLEYARQTITTAATGNEETENRFGDGGMPRGLITNDKSPNVGFAEYEDEELRNVAEDVTAQLRVNSIASLPGQAGFIPLTMSSSDMQFLETRKFTVREICRFYGVHPTYVFDDTSNNYKSAEMANVAFLSMTLDPMLKRIENEFTRKLVPRSLCCKRIFRFDRSGLYDLDLDSKAAYYAKMMGVGAFTVNDIRGLENKPPVEGGDALYVSSQLLPFSAATMNEETENEEQNG